LTSLFLLIRILTLHYQALYTNGLVSTCSKSLSNLQGWITMTVCSHKLVTDLMLNFHFVQFSLNANFYLYHDCLSKVIKPVQLLLIIAVVCASNLCFKFKWFYLTLSQLQYIRSYLVGVRRLLHCQNMVFSQFINLTEMF